MSTRARWRRLWMGLATLAGRSRGFFSPYRYAAEVAPTAYPELEAQFQAAEPQIRDTLDEISAASPDLAALAGPPPRPRWDQHWFPRLDGAAAYVVTRRARPGRIVEVGSGHSTRMLAHAAQGFGTAITCIDPAPRAALDMLDITWKKQILTGSDIEMFQSLQPGDIAFFDSSHLLWPGSDVDLILNRILPVLAPGVLLHLHDVTLPDAYPIAWGWRGYTEQLGLGGWLSGGGIEILFSSHYALTRMDAASAVAALPLPPGALETSLWLRRC